MNKNSESVSIVNSTQMIHLDHLPSKSREKKRKSKSKQRGVINSKESIANQSYKGYMNFSKRDVPHVTETSKHMVNLGTEKFRHRPTSSLIPADIQPRIPAQVISSLVQSRDASKLLRESNRDFTIKNQLKCQPAGNTC